MKNYLLIVVFYVLNLNFINAQNFVLNPGFETNAGCPTTDGQINKATGWIDPSGNGPDYFNSCADINSGYSVPDNDLGNFAARTGNAYAGIFTYFSFSIYTNLREYIQTLLSAPLVAGKTYTVSFYVARAQMCEYSASTIGAYFSANSISLPQVCDGSITPQVENPPTNIISSSSQWTLITGSFTAVGGEEFLTIGNFRTSDNSNPVLSGGSANTLSAYYLIDDISVVEDGTVGILNTPNTGRGFSIYPNPASNYMSISLSNDLVHAESISLGIYDVTGRKFCVKTLFRSNFKQFHAATWQQVYIFTRSLPTIGKL